LYFVQLSVSLCVFRAPLQWDRLIVKSLCRSCLATFPAFPTIVASSDYSYRHANLLAPPVDKGTFCRGTTVGASDEALSRQQRVIGQKRWTLQRKVGDEKNQKTISGRQSRRITNDERKRVRCLGLSWNEVHEYLRMLAGILLAQAITIEGRRRRC
jgi:hypothetical protein